MLITFPAGSSHLVGVTIPKAKRKRNFFRAAKFKRGQHWCWLFGLLAFVCFAYPVAGQSEANPAPTQYFLVPAETTSVRLHTHLADIDLGYDGVALIGAVNATYRLQNTSNQATLVTLTLIANPAGTTLSLPDNLVVLVNQQPVSFAPNESGRPIAQVQIGADTTLDLQLSYSVDLGDRSVAALRYNIQPLQQWLGQPSLRVSIVAPNTIPNNSWLTVAPEGWNYAPGSGPVPRIRWLYDPPLPDDPFNFTFIHPATWSVLTQETAAAVAGAGPEPFLRLGQRYTELHNATAHPEIRSRFYAQAVAAYLAGVDEAGGDSTNASLAQIHAGLAALYRTRSIGADGVVDRAYMDLMTSEADLALAGLDPADPRSIELRHWQVEGLTLQLNDARNRRNWPAAFEVLERLAALPPDVVDPSMLTETSRALSVQQALQLLEEGDNDAAMRLAGAEIANVDLLPPPNARSLFATWQVTATISPEQVDVNFAVLPADGRASEAQQTLTDLLTSWQNSEAASEITIRQPADGTGEGVPLEWGLSFPATVGTSTLARSLPPGADWVLARTVLAQLAPRVERTNRLLNQQIRLTQPLDLRDTNEQWRGIAATLEEQAAQIEAQSPNLNLIQGDTTAAEMALLARVRAANYRASALTWRTLARNSLVAVQLSAGIGVPPVTRTWLATPETPLQTLSLEADVISLGRLLVVLVIAIGGLFLLTGVLWSLL